MRLRRVMAWIDARSVKDRRLLLLAVLAGSYTFSSIVLDRPLTHRRSDAVARTADLEPLLAALRSEHASLGEALAHDPSEAQRQAVSGLEQEIGELDARARERADGLVSPDAMPLVLQHLLTAESELSLVGLVIEPPAKEEGDDALRAAPGLYEHTVELELEGGYLPTLRYLVALEGLSRQLRWDSLSYTVTKHPKARIKLRVHTLSLEEALIRA